MRFNVTQRDISRGQVADCYRCPVALSMRRTLGYQVHVVCPEECEFPSGETAVFPEEVSDAIECYDNDGEMAPFTFDLEIPEASDAES